MDVRNSRDSSNSRHISDRKEHAIIRTSATAKKVATAKSQATLEFFRGNHQNDEKLMYKKLLNKITLKLAHFYINFSMFDSFRNIKSS
jgi:hypothetical protein